MRIVPMIGLLIGLVFLTPVGAADAKKALESTADDQTAIELTVYNNNLGLVKDTRTIELAQGKGELRFMDVASGINPVTVYVKALDKDKDFNVLEQNYEYDLMSANKLLDKYVGRKIKIIDWNRYQDRKDTVEAELLSNNKGQIYRIDGEIYLGHPGVRVLPELPENLIAKPTLTWLYSGEGGPRSIEVSYLTRNINWNADYVLALNTDDTKADLSGWVTIDNKSGAAYKDARLKLVAGDVHRVDDRPEQREAMLGAAKARAPQPQFEEKAFFEYHIYDLQRKTSVKDKQTKQLRLLEARGIKTAKELLVYGVKSGFVRKYHPRDPKQPVDVYVKFRNSAENNLGMPLPAGVMRLYKNDDDGGRQFVGEDRIDHTPKDEEVRLKTGEAFDVVAERIQTDYKRITSRLHETEWKITLRNHKDTDVVVGIVEPLFGNWEVIDASHDYKKEDAFTIRFNVKVPKDGETTVKYRIRVGI